MKQTFLQDTKKLNIHPERWVTLKFWAEPPRQDWRIMLTESSLSLIDDVPKLATKRNAGDADGEGGLTEQPKCWLTREANLSPGSKQRSESPVMEEGSRIRRDRHGRVDEGPQWRRASGRRAPWSSQNSYLLNLAYYLWVPPSLWAIVTLSQPW
jgi:hypothetical protein